MKKKDSELIQRILDGDQSAFTALVEKYQKGVHALVWQKIGDFHIAQEITQDAFLRAYQNLDSLKNHNLFSGWLYVIATRLCYEWCRKKRIPMQSLETLDTKEVDKVAYTQYIDEQRETDRHEDQRELVRNLLKKLPESERTVMTLHYLGEMSCESISEFLGVSSNTIRSRLSRARNRLKKEEAMIKENLNSFQLPTEMTENIMKKISQLTPTTTPINKPFVPWILSAASAILVVLLMGVGAQNLFRFQIPYSLESTSKPTIEIVETQHVLHSPTEPAARNPVGHSNIIGQSNGEGQKPDTPLFAAAQVDDVEISKFRRKWVQTKGPEGGAVTSLFRTTNGDVFAGTRRGLYRLNDDETAWKLISNMEGPSHISLALKSMWWPVVERQNTLYLATINQILASTDRGETWDVLCESIEGSLVDMVITDGIADRQSDMTIYLAHTNGVFRTDNDGKSWMPLSNGLTDKEIRYIAAVEYTIFVGTDQGLYRLNNEKWEHLPVGKPDKNGKTQAIMDLAVDEHQIYVVIGDEVKHQFGEGYTIKMLGDLGWSLYRSTDIGNSWDSIDLRTEGFENRFRSGNPGVKLATLGENILVMDGKDHLYSSDEGETWTRLDLGNLSDIYNNSAALLYDANTFYKGGMHGIHRTTDNGMTWYHFNTGLIGTYVQSMVHLNDTLYVYTPDKGFLSSSDGGESWTLVSTDIFGEQLMMEYDDILYTTAPNSKLMSPRQARSSDLRLMRFSDHDKKLTFIQGMPDLESGDSWKLVPNSDTRTFRHDERIPNKNDLIKTDNWLEIKRVGKIASFAVSDAAYYVEYQYKLYRWKPGNSEWYDTGLIDEEARDKLRVPDDLPGPDTTSLKLAVSGETVYVGKRNGDLMQSLDEGDMWNNVTDNLPFPVVNYHTISFVDETIYIATNKGVIRSNNGMDWITVTDIDGKPLEVRKLAVDGNRLYGLAKNRIYQLTEDLNTWKEVTPEIPYSATCFDVDDRNIYVGTFGRGVYHLTFEE